VDTCRQIGQWRIWLVLLGSFLVNWLVLFAHYDSMSPVFYGIVSAWTSLFGADKAIAFTHYPQHFLLLGDYYGLAKLGVGLLVETAVLGFAVHLFARRFLMGGLAREQGEGISVSRWLNIVLVWVLFNVLTMVAGIYMPEWFAPLLTGSRRITVFNYVFMPGVVMGILSLLFFAIPAVVVFRENAIRAVWRSLKVFIHRPFTCFFLAFLVLTPPLLFSILSGNPADIVEKFKPELVYWLLSAGLLAEIVANFFWMGTAVRFFAEPEEL